MLNRYSQALKIDGNSPEYVEHLDHTMRLFAKFVKKDMTEVITEDILDFPNIEGMRNWIHYIKELARITKD